MDGDGTRFDLDADRALSFWTPERCRLARPIEPLRLDPTEAHLHRWLSEHLTVVNVTDS